MSELTKDKNRINYLPLHRVCAECSSGSLSLQIPQNQTTPRILAQTRGSHTPSMISRPLPRLSPGLGRIHRYPTGEAMLGQLLLLTQHRFLRSPD
jgi:hypothetical protein